MNWKLKTLSIEFMEWGEFKGNYVGKITFANGSKDAFTFTLSNEETQKYMEIIAAKVGASATELGQRVVESLQFLPPLTQPVLQIQAHAEEK